VEVRWQSLFRSTSLGMWCISYNALPTSRKPAEHRWSLTFHGWKSPEIAWGEIWTVWRCSNGVPSIHFFPYRTQNSIQIDVTVLQLLHLPVDFRICVEVTLNTFSCTYVTLCYLKRLILLWSFNFHFVNLSLAQPMWQHDLSDLSYGNLNMYSVYFSSCECNRYVFFFGGGGSVVTVCAKVTFQKYELQN
jgi:hypothetical protein